MAQKAAELVLGSALAFKDCSQDKGSWQELRIREGHRILKALRETGLSHCGQNRILKRLVV